MLVENMSLKQMLEFKPNDEDMLMLPLDIICYIKANVISNAREDNIDFLQYLFNQEEFSMYFKDLNKTLFYDFDGTHTKQNKFITIFELYSLFNLEQTNDYLLECLEYYHHRSDIIFDIYTHDNKIIRLSNLDGIVKSEPLDPLD